MTISTAELRTIFDRLITHLETEGVQTIDLEHDYYWSIHAPERYNVYENPGEPTTIGQLSGDWAEVKKLLDGSREPLAIYLIWFAAVLRAIGDQIVA
ncbi:MAG: hypothetical protein K8S97_04650 [Anaerolineae bacterium]|nr:hypothetical protein [Anaerolineae bacterium]